ncbi:MULTISPECIES: YIP1 family protein [unclassified Paracoccus (in: a-proteobacteria)]|uniref:YIP1 family protein n=1 Tax=unclassified Paracoccus (in: a-proteobacteria) TaxID=2688777 RepID=UPI0016024996|nr:MULTISPECIES: YIP1 family protein [unclassified Paracoccus (in: a-proteobacteria)]MBB1490340.1 YIP1 family protein [Paracoccus sp. MC1854]MBB1497182.1 YIP1 family protein [Paracoccus sp. MC1862]QQO44841.1 YIP1 family protein [Paracoccus sp. MC1862]
MIELMRLTVRDPQTGFRMLQARPWGPGDRWALVFATAAASAVLSWMGAALMSGPEGGAGVLGMLTASPISMASVQVVSAAFGAYLLAEVGRIFGGTGKFADALLAVGWIEAIMVALQTIQLAVTLILPPLGALVGIATLLLAAYLMVALTMAVHGFRNALMVVMGILGTIMLTSFLLSILAATLGVLPGAPT